ncbi:MAG: hypothetical protein QHH19_03240 [Candidatus Thermoplasmatota archaeon]|jgi:uncharacterized membrane protein|nr:hypothetical protein [Candidatus Thermoplasmatota archaeon]
MSAFNPKQILWVVIIALLVVIICIATYFLLTSSEHEQIAVLSPDDVLRDSDKYIGKTITVAGYFYHEVAEGRGFITKIIIPSGSSLTEYTIRLPVNYSDVNISLSEKVKYRFTGILKIDESTIGRPIVLVAKEIIAV